MRLPAIQRLAVRMLLALICSLIAAPLPVVGADLRPAEQDPAEQDPAEPQIPADQDGQSGDGSPKGSNIRLIGLAPETPPWFLERMRLLLHDGRAEDAYSLAIEALALFPDSDELRLGAAFAAQAVGRCAQMDSHLLRLDDDSLAVGTRRRVEQLRAACHGPWQQHLRIDAVIGYRPSLLDQARDPVIRLEQGSALHRLCGRLRFFCNPDRPLTSPTLRDNAIDFWYGLTLVNRYRASSAWDVDVETMLFRRRPFRPEFHGNVGLLRLTGTRHASMTHQLSLAAETGLSRFRLGRGGLSLSQRHFRAGLGLVTAHSATRRSHFGLARLTARSQWMKLSQDRLTYHHEMRAGAGITPWFGAAVERTDQSGSVMVADRRAREGSFGLHWKGRLGKMRLSQTRRTEIFRRPLPFLAAPHRARTRLTGLDLMPETGRLSPHLKVVLSFEYRKISSPDPYRLRSSRTLMLRLSYDAFKG